MMRFVAGDSLAGELRGKRIAERLQVPCDETYTEPAEWVVFVKTTEGMQQAKADGCRVIFDPVDYYCYDDGRVIKPITYVDLLVIPNPKCIRTYLELVPNAEFYVVPHQWDERIEGTAPMDQFRPGYVGKRYNLHEDLGIPVIHEDDKQLSAMREFNCHFSDTRGSLWAKYRKPATKCSSAAAVGAMIVCKGDHSTRYLLGDEYPFYTETTLLDGMWKAEKAFGTAQWDEALEMMAGAKEKSSMTKVCELYEVFK